MKKLSEIFYGKFPKLILGNEVVASIVDIIGRKLDITKQEIDNTLNTDL